MNTVRIGAATSPRANRAPASLDRLLLWTCVGIPMAEYTGV